MNSAQKIEMTDDQRTELLRYADAGLKWISGNISIDGVTRVFGKPDLHLDQFDGVEYDYFPNKLMTVRFKFEKFGSADGTPRVGSFGIVLDDNVNANISYEQWDKFGLHRSTRGELIDGARVEESDFFVPSGIIDTTGSTPDNYVTFSYRMEMPKDSIFDVNVGIDYLGEWIDKNGVKNFDNLKKNATDLREVHIYRHYLTPDELNKRNQAKREKYGYMNLCTGAICPETGIWEGWTKDGPTDVLHVEKGQKFDVVRTVSVSQSRAPCPMIPGQWMWLCSLEEQGGVTWNGMRLKG